jgi:hypothetical protein
MRPAFAGEALFYSSSPRRRGSSALIQLGSRLRGNDEIDLISASLGEFLSQHYGVDFVVVQGAPPVQVAGADHRLHQKLVDRSSAQFNGSAQGFIDFMGYANPMQPCLAMAVSIISSFFRQVRSMCLCRQNGARYFRRRQVATALGCWRKPPCANASAVAGSGLPAIARCIAGEPAPTVRLIVEVSGSARAHPSLVALMGALRFAHPTKI